MQTSYQLVSEPGHFRHLQSPMAEPYRPRLAPPRSRSRSPAAAVSASASVSVSAPAAAPVPLPGVRDWTPAGMRPAEQSQQPPAPLQQHPQEQRSSFPPKAIHKPASPKQAPVQTEQPSSNSRPHVDVACGPCKKAHLKCENKRPCDRCVKTNKQHLCISVTHKERGRPPKDPNRVRPCSFHPIPLTSLGPPVRTVYQRLEAPGHYAPVSVADGPPNPYRPASPPMVSRRSSLPLPPPYPAHLPHETAAINTQPYAQPPELGLSQYRSTSTPRVYGTPSTSPYEVRNLRPTPPSENLGPNAERPHGITLPPLPSIRGFEPPPHAIPLQSMGVNGDRLDPFPTGMGGLGRGVPFDRLPSPDSRPGDVPQLRRKPNFLMEQRSPYASGYQGATTSPTIAPHAPADVRDAQPLARSAPSPVQYTPLSAVSHSAASDTSMSRDDKPGKTNPPRMREQSSSESLASRRVEGPGAAATAAPAQDRPDGEGHRQKRQRVDISELMN